MIKRSNRKKRLYNAIVSLLDLNRDRPKKLLPNGWYELDFGVTKVYVYLGLFFCDLRIGCEIFTYGFLANKFFEDFLSPTNIESEVKYWALSNPWFRSL